MCSLKYVTALTSARQHIPAVSIIQLTTEVALQTLTARKNKEKGHLGTDDLGTAVAQPGLVQSPPSGPALPMQRLAASGSAN